MIAMSTLLWPSKNQQVNRGVITPGHHPEARIMPHFWGVWYSITVAGSWVHLVFFNLQIPGAAKTHESDRTLPTHPSQRVNVQGQKKKKNAKQNPSLVWFCPPRIMIHGSFQDDFSLGITLGLSPLTHVCARKSSLPDIFAPPKCLGDYTPTWWNPYHDKWSSLCFMNKILSSAMFWDNKLTWYFPKQKKTTKKIPKTNEFHKSRPILLAVPFFSMANIADLKVVWRRQGQKVKNHWLEPQSHRGWLV